MVLQVLCVLFLVPACGAALYFLMLALIYFTKHRDVGWDNSKGAAHTFAIIVPAHNEELTILNVLANLQSLDYPPEKFKVYVIADNCSDSTAGLARAYNCTCLERFDLENRGKGFALTWAFQQIPPSTYDGYVILDADCELAPHALKVFDQKFASGDKALQCEYVAANPDDSTISYAAGVGNVIENRLFYAPKSLVGLAVLLRGTGMAFHRDVLMRHPWDAFSIVEDTEYSLRLLRDGIIIRFLPGVWVKTASPVQLNQLAIQRNRWAENLRIGRLQGLKVMWEGLRRRSLTIADAGWTLLVLSRPIIFLELLVCVMLALSSVWFAPGVFSSSLFVMASGAALIQFMYVCSGVFLLGISRHRLYLLLLAPLVFVRLLRYSIPGVLGKTFSTWERTPRTGA